MRIILCFITLFQWTPVFSSYQALFCKSVFQITPPGYSQSGKPLRLPPAFEIQFKGRSSGHIRLQQLVRKGAIYSHPTIASRTLEIIKRPSTGIQFGARDSLFALDVIGDRSGQLFQNLVEGLIHSKALDIVGLDAYSIHYSATNEARGRRRVVLIMRDQIQDFREPHEMSEPFQHISNQDQALSWLSSEISAVFKTLFTPSVYQAMEDAETFERAYQLLGQRPNIPEDHPRSWLTKAQFRQAFEVAFGLMLQSINTSDLLYLRPSFWEDMPQPDRGALDLFHYSNQRSHYSVDGFIETFSEKALALRNRLYGYIHRTSISGGAGYGSSGDYKPSEYFVSRGTSGANSMDSVEISGVTSQQRYGLDFFSSLDGHYQTLSEATQHETNEVQDIASKLEPYGIVELTSLQSMDASKLILEAPFLSIHELQELAMALTKHGIFLHYPRDIYSKMDPVVRPLVKPPRNPSFKWTPNLLIYVPTPQ